MPPVKAKIPNGNKYPVDGAKAFMELLQANKLVEIYKSKKGSKEITNMRKRKWEEMDEETVEFVIGCGVTEESYKFRKWLFHPHALSKWYL